MAGGSRAVRHARGLPRDDRIASRRPRTDQRGDLVPRDRDGIVVLRELGANGGERGLGLLHLDPRVEPRREALRREAHDVFALRDRGLRDFALREEPLQVEIGAGDAGGEQHARRFGLRRRGLRARQRRLERRAVLVPEVELVGEVESHATVGIPAARERRREDVMLRVTLVGDAGVAVSCGDSAERATPAAAAARARRAFAAASEGLPARPSAMSASSCASS